MVYIRHNDKRIKDFVKKHNNKVLGIKNNEVIDGKAFNDLLIKTYRENVRLRQIEDRKTR